MSTDATEVPDHIHPEARGWYETALQHHRNEEYYRGLLDQMGEMLGPEARTADDGTMGDSVLRAKLPELLRQRLESSAAGRDAAYHERNQVVAALATIALYHNGWNVGIARTPIDGWDPGWFGCVYLNLPTGQCSWHYHDSEADLFAHLPAYRGERDGHSTPVKYERLAALAEIRS